MARACPLCSDVASNALVEQTLAGTKTTNEVAQHYKTNTQVVNLHINEHVQMALRPALRRIMMDGDTAKALSIARDRAAIVLVDKVAALSDRFDAIFRRAVNEDNNKMLTDTARALQGFLRELGVWTGDIKETITQVNVQANFFEFKEVMLKVLAKHPEVLAEMEKELAEKVIDVPGKEVRDVQQG